MANKKETPVYETEDRLTLRTAMFQSPGTTEHRGPTPRARASKETLPGRSTRAENRALEKAAEKRALEERLAMFEEAFGHAETARRAKEELAAARIRREGRKRMGLGRDDMQWKLDRESGETRYEKCYDETGVAWKDV